MWCRSLELATSDGSNRGFPIGIGLQGVDEKNKDEEPKPEDQAKSEGVTMIRARGVLFAVQTFWRGMWCGSGFSFY